MKRFLLLYILLVNISFASAQQFPNYEDMKVCVNDNSLPIINIIADIDNITKEKYIPAEIEITDPEKRTENKLDRKSVV